MSQSLSPSLSSKLPAGYSARPIGPPAIVPRWSWLVFAAPALVFVAACSKMKPEECMKLRDGAFELINTANMCSNDAECKPSEWPGCIKPVNAANYDKMHGMMEAFKKGKCEEKPSDCKPPPPVFCQEGICGFRYKAAPGQDMRIE